MFGSTNCRLNPIPENIRINPFNHTLNQRNYISRKVRIKGDDKKLKERMCRQSIRSAQLNGTTVRTTLLFKGKEKVTAELGLSFLAYNLRRAINMVGIDGILAAL